MKLLALLIVGLYLLSREQQPAQRAVAAGARPTTPGAPGALPAGSAGGDVMQYPFPAATKAPPFIDGLDVYQPDGFQVRLGS